MGAKGEMQFFRSTLFPATGEPPVLVSATFKFVPLSALFAEKCLFNFVYRHCKIFTRSLLLEQFSHHRGRWELDDGARVGTTWGCMGGSSRAGKFVICTRSHFSGGRKATSRGTCDGTLARERNCILQRTPDDYSNVRTLLEIIAYVYNKKHDKNLKLSDELWELCGMYRDVESRITYPAGFLKRYADCIPRGYKSIE